MESTHIYIYKYTHMYTHKCIGSAFREAGLGAMEEQVLALIQQISDQEDIAVRKLMETGRSVLQCVAVYCNVLQCVELRKVMETGRTPASHCNTLQHAATRCNTL